ncbi:MAG: hypothetical protein FJ135_10630 [Deltaproteobacteria bacterium]|nr:hypothetical protein [Deltaproteobacteria bacterium]
MAKSRCENCGLRARYHRNPQSLLGRLWRWHATWCPGWRAYMTSLPQEERATLAERYGLKKYQ